MADRVTPSRRFLPGDPRVSEPYRLTPQLALRVAVLGFLALALFPDLFLRLWALQVLSGERYLAQANDNRVPNYAETQQMINQLLLPVVIRSGASGYGVIPNPITDLMNLFGGSTEKGFAFDARYRPDGSRVDVKVDYADIPVELRAGIASDLETELGRKPTPDEIVQRYEQFVLSQ